MVIPLPNGEQALVDTSDYALVKGYRWRVEAAPGGLRYAKAGCGRRGKYVAMHQLLLPKANLVDHRNRNGLDNRRKNLRSATTSQNIANSKRRVDNTSGYKGVHRFQSGWMARLQFQRVRYSLGFYSTPEEAATAYGLHALAAFGEFARLW